MLGEPLTAVLAIRQQGNWWLNAMKTCQPSTVFPMSISSDCLNVPQQLISMIGRLM